ncbi:MAG TPA: methyltransferase domain-containing protein [Candidatus Paceibacterota bacterium]|nr:methyltransferase domain-containing protein [Verrucomicrobiota bacterium]HRY49596.1 methyltransferase domain-containing protein [Candidatus Paceibacterota bacterium]
MKSSLKIPKHWTFRNQAVAKHFDRHVREQLPWYGLATQAMANFGRHYIPSKGMVYDIGASTGNIGLAIKDTVDQRQARFIAIEESQEMADRYQGPPELVVADAMAYEYEPFDFAVCFLVLMFLPVQVRAAFLHRLQELTKPGGALVVVDKVQMPPGYVGTAFSRLTLQQKLITGTPPEAIIRKELSLAGYQRPLDPKSLPASARTFFQMGEFVGWIIEKEETHGTIAR